MEEKTIELYQKNNWIFHVKKTETLSTKSKKLPKNGHGFLGQQNYIFSQKKKSTHNNLLQLKSSKLLEKNETIQKLKTVKR